MKPFKSLLTLFICLMLSFAASAETVSTLNSDESQQKVATPQESQIIAIGSTVVFSEANPLDYGLYEIDSIGLRNEMPTGPITAQTFTKNLLLNQYKKLLLYDRVHLVSDIERFKRLYPISIIHSAESIKNPNFKYRCNNRFYIHKKAPHRV